MTRLINTLDANDWIILRLLTLCARNSQLRCASDVQKAIEWIARGPLGYGSEKELDEINTVLHADINWQAEVNKYLCAQFVQPVDLDGLVPFEAFLTSVQTNDA